MVALICDRPCLLAQETQDYDVEHYELRIVPDFAQRTIRVESAVSLRNPGMVSLVQFELGRPYRVATLQVNGQPAEWTRNGQSLQVKVPARKQVRLFFTLEAQAPRSEDEERAAIEDESLFLLWSDRFYPTRFNDWATVRTTLVLPTRFLSIAPGKLVRTSKADNQVQYVFETQQPTVQFSVIADSRWIRTSRTVRGRRMQTLLHPESQKYSEQIFATSSDVLDFFSEWFGPYPAEEFSFVTTPGMYARRAFSGFVGYEPKYLEKEMTTTGHDAHETSLLWWGYTTRGRGPGAWQWTEGFGDYAEVLYDEARHKPLPRNFTYFRNEYLKLPPDRDVAYTELRGNTPQAIVHGKYPWLMHVLRYQMGEEAFRKGMRMLFARYRFRSFSLDEFLVTFEKAGGRPLQTWREQWLERKGVPVLAMQTRFEGGAHPKVRVILEQRGELYDLPLEVGLEGGGTMRIEKVHLTERQQEFVFDAAEEPRRILLDPKGWVLMKIAPE